MMSVAEALVFATTRLADANVEDARSEARALLTHTMKWTTAQVFARPDEHIENSVFDAFVANVDDRAAGKPFAHITGQREFWSMPFEVSSATLVPRPDTETVVELALALFKDRDAPEDILDIGTGSGCLLLALLENFKTANGIGIDISEDAIVIAKRNADRLGLRDRAGFYCRSWEEPIGDQFDLIVSNPPYIPTHDIPELAPSVRDFEPRLALDGGIKGLDAYHYLIPKCANLLRHQGILIVEIGIDQREEVAEIAVQSGFALGPIRKDLAGIERALSFCKKDVGISKG